MGLEAMSSAALRCLAALGCLLLFRAPALCQARLWLPHLTVQEGNGEETVFLHSRHQFPLSGFSFGIRCDPLKLSITEVTYEGTGLAALPEPVGFWSGTISPEESVVVCGAVLDTTLPLTSFLPPAEDHTLARLKVRVKAAAGEQATLELVDGLGGSFPVDNLLVDDLAASHAPALFSGTIVVAPPEGHVPPIVDAGSDLLVSEGGVIVLDGSGSGSPLGLPLSHEWVQLPGGPPAQPLTGLDVVQPRFSLPPLTGDALFRFQLTVSDGVALSRDTVEVHGIDVDLRRGTVAVLEEPCAAPAGDGRRPALFQGELSWETVLEDAFWTAIRFTASGEGDESRLLASVSLHVDENGNGCLDDGDRRIGEAQVLASDNAPVEFSFAERVVSGSPVRFFLVGEVAPEVAPRAGMGVLAGLLLLGGWGASRKRGRMVSCTIALLLLPLLFSSCGGGGGGGRGGVAPASREVRFSVLDASDLAWEGASTRVQGGVSGLPVHGRAIRL